MLSAAAPTRERHQLHPPVNDTNFAIALDVLRILLVLVTIVALLWKVFQLNRLLRESTRRREEERKRHEEEKEKLSARVHVLHRAIVLAHGQIRFVKLDSYVRTAREELERVIFEPEKFDQVS